MQEHKLLQLTRMLGQFGATSSVVLQEFPTYTKDPLSRPHSGQQERDLCCERSEFTREHGLPVLSTLTRDFQAQCTLHGYLSVVHARLADMLHFFQHHVPLDCLEIAMTATKNLQHWLISYLVSPEPRISYSPITPAT